MAFDFTFRIACVALVAVIGHSPSRTLLERGLSTPGPLLVINTRDPRVLVLTLGATLGTRATGSKTIGHDPLHVSKGDGDFRHFLSKGRPLRDLRATREAIAFFSASFPRCYGNGSTSQAALKWAKENGVE